MENNKTNQPKNMRNFIQNSLDEIESINHQLRNLNNKKHDTMNDLFFQMTNHPEYDLNSILRHIPLTTVMKALRKTIA